MALTVLSTLQLIYPLGQGTTTTYAVPVHGWHGYPLGSQTNSEVFTRPGQIGSGRQIINQRAPKQTIRIVSACATMALAVTIADNISKCKGSKIHTDNDPWGYAWDAWLDDVSIRVVSCAGDCVARVEADLIVELTQ